MVAVVLLSTCRYILKVQRPDNHAVFFRLALQYKLICLRALREEMSCLSSISSGSVGVVTVAKALALALDEVSGIHSYSCGS